MASSQATAAPSAPQQPVEVPSAVGRHSSFKHGLCDLPEYRAWQTMRLRCSNPENKAYPNYGGRGITVCERWKEDFLAFLADMGRKPSPKHELDRENNNGNYEPGNCRWVLRKINDRNRRSSRLLEYAGEIKALAQWCEDLGLPRDTVRKRLEAGWTVEESLTIAPRSKKPNGSAAIDKANRVLKRPHRPKITNEAIAEIERLFRAGKLQEEIMKETGVSINSVARIIKKLGLTRTVPT